ncbi:Speckle-type POZ protein-like protein A [Hordeum vulgare]|nr:Speckle-type POZ protein-like protein A [Hordeum vulgare]
MADSSSTTPEITWRRVTAWEQTGTFNFEVTDYLRLAGMGVGEYVSWPDVEVGGSKWKIKFYPDGVDEDCDGHASAFVRWYSQEGMDPNPDPEVIAKFTLRSQVNLDSCGPAKLLFSPLDYQEWGCRDFVERSKLEELSQLGDGCFTIRCVLAVVTDGPPPPPELPSQLFSQLESMLDDGTGADVTFRVGRRKFRGHRCFLAARSPVFRAQFYGPMARKDKPRVKVIDVEPAIFEMMLHYIYTDSLPPPSDADDQGGYGVAADMYDLERLKLMCADELCKTMDAATVMSTYALANQHHCNRLKDSCVEFMSSKQVLAAILETNEHFMTRCRPLPLSDGGHDEEEQVDQRKRFKRARTKYMLGLFSACIKKILNHSKVPQSFVSQNV